MATAVQQYYCYQCMNQAQVDMTTFTCRRCGGGFIQEMPSDPLPPPRDPAPVGSAVNLGSQGSSSVQTHMGPHGDFSPMFGNPAVPPHQQQQQQHPLGPMLPMPLFQTTQQGAAPMPSMPVGTNQPGVAPARPIIHGQVTFTQHMPGDPSGRPPHFVTHRRQIQSYPPTNQVPHHHHHHHQVQFDPNIIMRQIAGGGAGPMMQQGGQHWHGPGVPQFVNGQFNPMQQQQLLQQQQQQQQQQMMMMQAGVAAQNGNPVMPQHDGVLIFGVGDGAGPNVQNIVQMAGGNMNQLMQLLTENIDDVITAILNQMGTQGGPPPITQQDVDRIPTNPVTKEMIAENKSCSICLETFLISDPFKELSCTHQFHGPCIDRWLLIHGNCPICRAHFGGGGDGANGENAELDWMNGGPNFVDILIQGNPEQPVQVSSSAQPRTGPLIQPPFRPNIQHMYRPRNWQSSPQHPGASQPNRTFVFSPPANQMHGGQVAVGQAQPVFFHNQPAAGRLQFANVGGPQGGQNPENPNAGEAMVWSGQVFLNGPQGPTIVLDLQGQQPHLHGQAQQQQQQQPQQSQPHHHHQQHRPQQQMGPIGTAIRQQMQEQMNAAQQRPARGEPRRHTRISGRAAAPNQTPRQERPQAMPQLFQSLINTVTQAFVRPAAPESTTNPPSATTTAASVTPSAQNDTEFTPAEGSSAAGTQAPNSPARNSGNRPPHLEDDLGFD